MKGIATIRAFGWGKEVVALNDKLLDKSQRPAYLLAMIQRWLQFILQLVVAVLATVVVVLVTQLRSNSAFAGASLVTLMTFGNSLSFLIRVYTVVETSMGAVSRLKTFSEFVKPENLPGENVVPPLEWPMRGSIEIRGVSASYE
jgi:ATP-binding cassette, subfamily C (CFTR/MRP), member 1